MNIGVVLSAGGSSFFEAYDILIDNKMLTKENIIVITDRECIAEKKCNDRGIACVRFHYQSANNFSSKVYNVASGFGVSVVFLYYSRLLTSELYEKILTINFHPSLLPAFKGMGAVKKAYDLKVKYLGASAHLINHNIDSGELLCQTVIPVSRFDSLEYMERASFLQKIYLSLCCVDILSNKYIDVKNKKSVIWNVDLNTTCNANPIIPNSILQEAFKIFQNKIGIEVIKS